jgi:hypothetical protein
MLTHSFSRQTERRWGREWAEHLLDHLGLPEFCHLVGGIAETV